MARARLIKPGLFKNEDLSDCPFEARLLFIGLWTIADRDGFVEYRPKRIKAELFPYDEVDVPFLVMKLHGKKFLSIVSFENTLFIHVLGFKHHQNPHPKEADSVVDANAMRELTYEEAVKLHGEPCKETARNAFNPLILLSSSPSILQSDIPVETSSTGSSTVDSAAGVETPKATAKRFVPPTVEQVQSLCAEKGYQVNAQDFVDFYSAQGWCLSNKIKMTSWPHAVARWNRYSGSKSTKTSNDTNSQQNDPAALLDALNARQKEIAMWSEQDD